MNVLLVANYRPDAQQSMLRFASVLDRELRRRGHEVRVLRPRAILGRGGWAAGGISKVGGYLDKFALFVPDLYLAQKWADVAHLCDHANALYLPVLHRVPVVVTCHDLLAVQSALGEIDRNSTRWTGRLLQAAIRRALDSAHHLVCISEETRSRLERLCRAEDARVSLLYNGLNYPYRPMETERAHDHLRSIDLESGERFFLHVGGNQWYKNRPGVLRIYAELRRRWDGDAPALVMVGKPFTAEMKRLVRRHGIAEHVHARIGVSNEELRALYSEAEGLVFPSLQEGFGWPIAEAQACGCPVFTSDRRPMTEVGGDAAVYFDPEAPKEAARIIQSQQKNASRLRRLSVKNAERFSTDRMVDGYVHEYEIAVSGAPVYSSSP